MVAKKALRLTAAAALAGMTLGAGAVHGAAVHHAQAASASGVVTITDWQFPDGCGPGAAAVSNQEICAFLIGENLFQRDQNLNYYPDLAESIPTLKNGGAKIVNGNLVVTYKLKPNLKWSDGVAITANDIVFNVNLSIALGNTFGVDQIAKMQVVDARTAVFTYKGTYAPYVAYGNAAAGNSYFYPQHYLEKKYGTTNITALAAKFGNDSYNSPNDVWDGPYKISSYTNGQSVVMTPNPYYNVLGGSKPRPAQIKFQAISTEEAALATALGSANAGVDKAEDFQTNDLPVLQSSKYRIQVLPELTLEHLELNQNGPLKDVRLRQAVQYAIDKTTLFHELFPTVASSQISQFVAKSVVPNSSKFLDPSLSASAYDPNKAKALLKAAGYATSYNGTGNHLELRFVTTPASIRQKDFQILSRDWANVGIHVSATYPSGSASANGGLFSPYNLNGVLSQRHFDIALFAFTESPDPQQNEQTFSPVLIPTATRHSNGDENYSGVADADQYALLQKARSTLDTSQRLRLFYQWENLLNQRVYWVPLYTRQDITADNKTIGNFVPNGSDVGNDWNAWNWYKTGAS